MSASRWNSGPTPQSTGDTQGLATECRTLLEEWLRQEQERQNLTQRLYANRESPGSIEQLLDRLERNRNQLLQATRELLDRLPHGENNASPVT